MTASWSENSTCGQQLPRDPVTVGGSRCASRWQISAMSRVTGPFLVARTRGFGREEQVGGGIGGHLSRSGESDGINITTRVPLPPVWN